MHDTGTPNATVLRQLWTRSRSTVKYLVDLEFNRRFERWPGSYRGIFGSFAEARASAPSAKLGFDHPELAHLYDSRIGKAFTSDYPVLFWLGRILHEHSRVFDWGGHVGVSYYTYQKYLGFSDSVRWCVGEVPEIAKAGRELAQARGAASLSFTTPLAEADGFEVLLANGSLQYVEMPFADSLAAMKHRPRHVIVNKIPVYSGESFVTLENTVHSYNAYQVRNRQAFLDSINRLGYSLIDDWESPDVQLHIPLHRERTINAYPGFYFRAD